MKLLALDAAGDACSVALGWHDSVFEYHRIEPRRQAESLLPAIDRLLAEAGTRLAALDAIVLGRGPGSFTGVRIATAVCQGLAWGAGLPVVTLSSLAILAQGVWRERGWRNVLVAQDARMAEVYAGVYRLGADGLMAEALPDGVSSVEALLARIERAPGSGELHGAGSAWEVYGEALRAGLDGRLTAAAGELRWARARDALALGAAALARGEAVAPGDAVPVYLRDRVTQGPARDG